jgi:cell division protein FtsW
MNASPCPRSGPRPNSTALIPAVAGGRPAAARLVMVYSSSIAMAEGSRFTGHQPAYFLLRHAVFLAIGLVAGVMAFQIPLRLWQQLAPWLFIAGVALLLMVLIPACRRSVNGAQRWIPWAPSICSPPS